MRQSIETAPKDGKDIWVEDDQAACDVAHWSSETKQWVWKNGGAIRITATHWTPIPEPQYQEGRQSSSPLQIGRERRRLTASLIAAALVVAALIGMCLRSEMVGFATRFADLLDIDDIGKSGGRESLGTGLVRAPDADLREAAGGSQLLGRREATAALMPDAEAARHAVPASTVQYREALEQETLLNDTLAGELSAVRSELDAKVALANKAVVAQLRRLAEVTTAELQKSLQHDREKSAALTSELAKARIDFETAVALSSKSHDETVQRSQGAEVTAEELRKSLQQEHAAALARELAGKSREIEAQAAQSQMAVDEAVQQKQAAEGTIAELRQSLEQQRDRTEAMARDLATVRTSMDGRVTTAHSADSQIVRVTQAVRRAATESPKGVEAQGNAEATRLIARARTLLGQGNIGAARIVLERAAESGNAQASFILAETYDPVILSAWGTHGTRGEAAKARELYATAQAGGILDAKDRLERLDQ